MGGKHKQKQRTKNNTRPSSSARSAELLGSTLPQFPGFSGVKESTLAASGFTHTSDDFETLLDSNFQLVFKKMTKKDSTTRLKALQEFTDLVKAAEVDAVKIILPFWPRLYCTLAIDGEHKVREATHLAHHQLVLKAKRNVAPYLKQLAGAWFISQYDTYAPSASAATRAFQECFPSNKLQDAVVFCQDEILSYICDNLTLQASQKQSNTNTTSSEDAELKYHRIITSSLNSYTLYLSTVSSDEIEKHSDLNWKIISNPTFWKLVKNKIPSIRSAWFGVITMLCQKAQFLMQKEASRIVGCVFGNLDENEPTVLPAVWEAALSIISLMNEWWKFINIDKVFLPKLYKVLKDAGNGNAAVIFPNLLPLISHLPDVIDVHVFFPTFFENMQMGLKSNNVQGSRIESHAICGAFIECLQYIIMKNQSDIALCEKLIKTQLFPLLEWSFNDTQTCYKSLYIHLAILIQFWDRNHNEYEKYLTYFWHNLESLFLGLLLNLSHGCEVTPAQLTTKQMTLLLALKRIKKTNKIVKVSFDSEKHQDTDENITTNFSVAYVQALNDVVYKTCKAYIDLVNEKRLKDLIEQLLSVVQHFESSLFSSESNNVCDIYREVLLKWLNDDELCSKPVVELIFLLFKYFKDDKQKTAVLTALCNIAKEDCLGWSISQALSYPSCLDPVVLQWVRNDSVSRFLLGIAEKEVANDSKPELSLILKRIFTDKTSENVDLIVSETTVQDILKIIIQPLLDPHTYPTSVDSCARFCAYISTIIYAPNYKLKYNNDLLFALVKLSNYTVPEEMLSADTDWEISTAWLDVIHSISQTMPYDEFKPIAEKCCIIITQPHTKKSSNLIASFIKSITNKDVIENFLIMFLKLEHADKWRNDLTNLCEQAEYTKGNLYVDHQVVNKTSVDELDIEKYFEWMNIVVSVLIKLVEDDMETYEYCNYIVDLLDDDCDVIICDLFCALSLGKLLLSNYASIKPCQTLQEIVNSFEDKMMVLRDIYPEYDSRIRIVLIVYMNNGGWLSVNCLYNYFMMTKTDGVAAIYKYLVNECVPNNKPILLYLTQIWTYKIQYFHNFNNLTILETVVALRSLLFQPNVQHRIYETFSLIQHVVKTNQITYNSNMHWKDVDLIIGIVHFFASTLKYRSECVDSRWWDFILTSFVTWCENVVKALSCEIQTKTLILALSDLFVSIMEYVENCNRPRVVDEWNDIFAQDVHSRFLEVWCYFVGQMQSQKCSITDIPFLQGFGKNLCSLQTAYIFNNNCSVKWSKLLSQSFRLLTHPTSTMQLWGYNMIMKLIPGLVQIDATAVSNNTPHQNGLIIEQFKTTLIQTQDVVHSMLLEFKLGDDSCRLEPFTDSYTYTFAYLLLWDAVLYLCEQSSPELRYQYSDWLRKDDFVRTLLNSLFKLMPLEMDANDRMSTKWFITRFATEFTAPTSQYIETMVCWIYSYILTQLPVLARQWWCNQETRVAQVVERITSTFVSTYLCKQELADLMKHEHKFKNMTIKTYAPIREVVAIYTVDEVQMELIIALPPNYPLVGPDIHCDKQMLGVSHRQWLMQLKMCILHQDGRIWDGLMLWNNNLDKRFEGVQECYICFAVMHQGTYQIPRISCQTCKKKFHSACLYKWFSTSNKSTCPVCRNLF